MLRKIGINKAEHEKRSKDRNEQGKEEISKTEKTDDAIEEDEPPMVQSTSAPSDKIGGPKEKGKKNVWYHIRAKIPLAVFNIRHHEKVEENALRLLRWGSDDRSDITRGKHKVIENILKSRRSPRRGLTGSVKIQKFSY